MVILAIGTLTEALCAGSSEWVLPCYPEDGLSVLIASFYGHG